MCFQVGWARGAGSAVGVGQLLGLSSAEELGAPWELTWTVWAVAHLGSCRPQRPPTAPPSLWDGCILKTLLGVIESFLVDC